METQLTITLDDGTEADVTVSYTLESGCGSHRCCGESQDTTPGDYDEVTIHSVVTCDGNNVMDECDLDEVEMKILEENA